MSTKVPAATKHRLLSAAAALFAERGFHATTARDIADRAGVNLAASNYHYGSKRDLYLEVLRAQFSEVRAQLERRGATWAAGGLVRRSRSALIKLLHARMKVVLDMLIGPPPGLHGTLMQREMCDPSAALPVIVAEFIRPMLGELEQIVAQLAPDLDRVAVEHCAFSIIGQALFYRTAMPAVLHMQGRRSYPRGAAAAFAAHIAEFSVGGIDRLTSRPRRRRAS